MVKILTVLMVIVAVASAKIIMYPIADDLYAGADTIDVTTTETKFAVGDGGDVRWLQIINHSAVNLISIKVQQGDSIQTVGSYCGAWGTWPFPMANALLTGPAVDSLWIDADGSASIVVEWLEVK